MASKIRWGISIFIIVLLIAALRVILTEKHYIEKANSFYKDHRYLEAVFNYGKALHFYLPFSPYNREAVNMLLELSKIFEKRHQTTWELYSLETLRSSLYATRSFYLPFKKLIPKLDDTIASIKAHQMIKSGYLKSFPETKKELLNIMYKNLSPNPFWSLLAVLSLLGWILSILAIIWTNKKTLFIITYILSFAAFVFSLLLA